MSMRKNSAFIIPISLLTGLLLVSPAKRFLSPSFEEFTMEIFRHELEDNTINLHYTLADPSVYNIQEKEAGFGLLSLEEHRRENDYIESCRKKIARYMERELTEEEQLTAEILDWWMEGLLAAEDYYYYQEPISPTLGIQAQLPVLLAEFPFRDEQDIQIYLELLEELPVYFEQLAAYEKEKAAQGLFMNDESLAKVLETCRTQMHVGKDHFLAQTFRERVEACDFLTADEVISYEAQNLKQLNQYYSTSYQALYDALSKLQGTSQNPYGLYHTPDGISYYEYLLKYSIGTERSIAEITQLLDEQMEDDYETILYALDQNVDLLSITLDSPSGQSPQEILTALESDIREDFPALTDEVVWSVKHVPKTMENYLSPAFYLTPAIDCAQENVIYINPSYAPDQTELVTTLAHEGYPGHLYQNVFESSKPAVRSLVSIGGYTEGWGLYSEFYAYDFCGLSDSEADFLRSLSSLNYAVCAMMDLFIHGEGWTENDCAEYLAAFGITDAAQIHALYQSILEEPSNYLKYYLGYLEICKLKESAATLSSGSSVYAFHKWFLEMGPAPFGILQEHLIQAPLTFSVPDTGSGMPESPAFLALPGTN